MPLDWDRLRIFHKVALAKSFTRASAEVNLSQSAVSRQISALEREVGTPLFNRHARGLVLTEQGEILFRATNDVTARIENAHAKLTDFGERPRGPLRVTTTVGLGSAWLAPRLHHFVDRYPEIELDLALSNDELDLTMREADCALRLRPPSQADLIQRRLFTVHFHVYASPGYIDAYGHPETVEDLDDHRIVVWGGGAPGYLQEVNWLLTAGMPQGKQRSPVVKINSLLAIRRAIERGAGIALLPDYSIEESSELKPVMRGTDVPSFDTFFVYSDELRHSARLIAFRDFVLEQTKNWRF